MQQDLKTLLDAARGGDDSAYTRLYEMTVPRALGMARSMLKSEDDAMDVVQESYICAFRSLDQLKSPESFPAWFNTIVINRSKNALTRSKARRYEVSLTDEEGEELDWEDESIQFRPDESLDYSETKRLVREIVDDLPEEQRTCVLLYYFQDMKIREIAETMEVSENTVKSRLSYAKRKIEKDVRELERQGTKLYAVPFFPFLRWMVEKDVLALAEKGSGTILANVAQSLTAQGAGAAGTTAAASAVESTTAAAATESAATAGTAAATESAATTAGTAAAKAGVLHTVGGKLAVGVLAAAVAAGGGAALASHNRQEPPPAVEVSLAAQEEPPLAEPILTDRERAQAVFAGAEVVVREERTSAVRITIAIADGFAPELLFDSRPADPISGGEAGGLGRVSTDGPALYEAIRQRLPVYGYAYQNQEFGLVKAFNDYRGVETSYILLEERVDGGWSYALWSYDKAADVFTLADEFFVPEAQPMIDNGGPAPNIERVELPPVEEPEPEEPEEEEPEEEPEEEEEEPEPEPEPVQGGDVEEWIRLVNDLRAQSGKPPMTMIGELMELAEEKAEELLHATVTEIYGADIAGQGIQLMRPYDDRGSDRALITTGGIGYERYFPTAQDIVDYDLRYNTSSPLYTKDQINVGVGYYEEDGAFLWIMVEVWFD